MFIRKGGIIGTIEVFYVYCVLNFLCFLVGITIGSGL